MRSVRLESFTGGSWLLIMIFVSGPVFTTSPHIQSTLRSVQPRRKTESASTGALSFASPRAASASSVSMPRELGDLVVWVLALDEPLDAREVLGRARARARRVDRLALLQVGLAVERLGLDVAHAVALGLALLGRDRERDQIGRHELAVAHQDDVARDEVLPLRVDVLAARAVEHAARRAVRDRVRLVPPCPRAPGRGRRRVE